MTRRFAPPTGASAADRALWQEFTANPEAIAAEAEEAYDALGLAAPTPPAPAPPDELQLPSGETETIRSVRARRVQSFFRAAILTSYENRCAVSGLRLPVLLNASHIIPWSVSPTRRADPTNGLCLNALFDRAFDRGLMTIGEDLRIVMSPAVHEAAGKAPLACSLLEAEGRQLIPPVRFMPDPEALEFHRRHVFQA